MNYEAKIINSCEVSLVLFNLIEQLRVQQMHSWTAAPAIT